MAQSVSSYLFLKYYIIISIIIITSNECKALSGERRCEREEGERDKNISLMPYGTLLEILALLDCIALPIALAIA